MSVIDDMLNEALTLFLVVNVFTLVRLTGRGTQ